MFDRLAGALLLSNYAFELDRFSLFFSGDILHNPDFYSRSEKVVVALIVTGECGAGTIGDNNSKTMQCIPFNIVLSTLSLKE